MTGVRGEQATDTRGNRENVEQSIRNAVLVLLTWNELPGVRAVWSRIPFEVVAECLAVDGGSTDGTREFLQEKGIRVVEQDRPGWGEAVRLGVRVSQAPSLVFFSPDGKQDPADIPLLLDRLAAGYDLVIASRFLPESVHAEDGQYLKPRARGAKVFTRAANKLFGHRRTVSDATNGFRAITRRAFERLRLDAPGFELAYQMTLRAMKAGLEIAEVPTFEGPRLAGSGKFRIVPATWEHIRVLGKEWLVSAS